MSDSGLVVTDLTVRFGGLTAVEAVSLRVEPGRLVGLIGPNGAGKTTTFNACCGLVQPAAGRIELFGEDVTRLSPSARAQRGLGRTFQRMELYDRLSVRENVEMGLEARLAGGRPFGVLSGTRRERRAVREAAERAMERCGIGRLAGQRAGALSSGERRLVELARALAGGFRILLLDEPSSGLDTAESEVFGRIVCSVVDEGIGVLLVEHDMALVSAICTYVYVLDFGKIIEEGSVRHVLTSPAVRAAYLGEGEVA